MKIRDLMTLEVEVLDPDASLQEAAELMRDMDVGTIPVVEDDRVVGILTDRDIVVRGIAEGLDASGTKAADVMTEDVVFCYEDQDVKEAAKLMQENQIRRLIILDREEKLAGIISLGDLAVETGNEKMAGRVLEKVSEPAASPESSAAGISGGASRGNKGGRGVDNVGFLIRDELAAVETYRQALEKIDDAQTGVELKRIEAEHEEAVALLQEHMSDMGVEPPTSSGVWGAWAKAVEGTAKLLGEKTAIKALKEGEEHGIKDYEEALRDEALDFELKELISTNLLPRTRSHVPVLDRFLQGKR